MFRLLCLAAACAIGLTISASALQAGDSTFAIDKRQDNQKSRIKEGIKSGSLTKKEARNLARRQKHIQKFENDAAADGKITDKERRRLRRAQKRQSANIYRKKHNRRNLR